MPSDFQFRRLFVTSALATPVLAALPLPAFALSEAAARDCLGHRHHIAFAGQIVKEIFHLCLKVQPVPQHQIGPGHGDDIGAGLTVRVRIDPRPHQPLDLNQISTDLACRIGDHAGGGNDAQRRFRPGSHRRNGQ